MMSDKKTIYISGFFGVPNVGDAAICLSEVTNLRGSFAGMDVYALSRNRGTSMKFTRAEADFLECYYPEMPFWKNLVQLIRLIWRARLVVIGGGGLWQDVHSWTTTVCHLIPGSLALLFGRPVCTLGLGVGPVRRKWLRSLIRVISSRFSLVLVRSEPDRQELLDCGVSKEKIVLGADVALSLFSATQEEWDGPRGGEGVVGLSIRAWPGLKMSKVAELIETLVKAGKKVRLLCFELPSAPAFYNELLALCPAAVRDQCEVFYPATLEEAITGVRETEGLIAMRLHACVFGAGYGVPFLSVSYDPKVKYFAEALGLGDFVVSVADVDAGLAGRLEEVKDYWQKHRAEIRQQLSKMVGRSKSQFESVKKCRGQGDVGSRLIGLGTFLFALILGFPYLIATPLCMLRDRLLGKLHRPGGPNGSSYIMGVMVFPLEILDLI
jgi:polysaccharide pyruvyl transferase WcaK-like protein